MYNMKNTALKIAGIIVILSITISSCKKWIDTDINDDPNRPLEVTMPLLLPSAEGGIAYAMGGDLSRPACIWMQQIAGIANQPLAFDKYYFTQSDVDNVWKWGLYAGPLKDLNGIMSKAQAEASPWYGGIARILMAYSIGTMSDLWNDIPYSDAFKGLEGNLNPKYDTQQQIYAKITELLDGAISDLNTAVTANRFIPSTDDMIYQGDVAKWLKAAYTLKARYALHLSELNGISAYNSAWDALKDGKGFSSNSDDLEFMFGANYNEENPLSQFLTQRPGDMGMGKYFVDYLKSTNDPRLSLFVDISAGDTIGSAPGQGDNAACNPGPYYGSPNSTVPLITYVEAKFIEAEVKLQTGNPTDAATAFNDAVKASLLKTGATNTAAFIAAYASETSESISLSKIIQQKYIALYLQSEVFVDYRRTGYPVLSPAPNGQFVTSSTTTIPARRYPYPTSERIYNTSNCPSVLITGNVWWDN
jgi:hypothetical protein